MDSRLRGNGAVWDEVVAEPPNTQENKKGRRSALFLIR